MSGITTAGISAGGTLAFGGALPAARIGGGWVVGYSNGTAGTTIGRAALTAPANIVSTTGTVLLLSTSPTAAITANAGVQLLTPNIAAQMDRKMDDGQPESGFAQAYGVQNSCFGAAVGGPYAYQELVTSKDCGILFRIQG